MDAAFRYLTRDRHFLLKGEGDLYVAHYSRRQDHIEPWGDPTSLVYVPADGLRDGPVGPRVAIVDLDTRNSTLRPGAEYRPPTSRRHGEYVVDSTIRRERDRERLWAALESDGFLQVSCFGTVMSTLQFIEERIGRQVEWAFGRPQLLVVPRAGELRNAFYERESGSLQFYHWRSKDRRGSERTTYTALSHDIVAHETTHAVLDGLAPDLYDASAPESLALHESLADLVAILKNLKNQLFEAVQRPVDLLREFGEIAEEYGTAARTRAEFLRTARNSRTLDPRDESRDAAGFANSVDVTDSHALSEVMTGAVYGAYVSLFKKLRGDKFHKLMATGEYLSRVVLEALNYLPPGEVSFADLGRALLVSVEQGRAHAPEIFREYLEPNALIAKRAVAIDSEEICDRFSRALSYQLVRRRVVGRKRDLAIEPPALRLDRDRPQRIRESAGEARAFVAAHRATLGIPDAAEFSVSVAEAVIRRRGCRSRKQLIVRIRWMEDEEHDLGLDWGNKWSFPAGSALVIDPDRRRVISLLTSDLSERRRRYRRNLLVSWAISGRLAVPEEARGPDGELSRQVIAVAENEGRLRIRGSARTLHLANEAL